MNKRTKDDPEWMALKRRVKDRDKGCRLIRICTPQEYYILIRKAGPRISHCDPAHVFGVGSFPHLCYVDDNVVMLNRYSHDLIDSCKNPVTGDFITREERDEWWKRIVGKETYDRLEKMAYNRQGAEDERRED